MLWINVANYYNNVEINTMYNLLKAALILLS